MEGPLVTDTPGLVAGTVENELRWTETPVLIMATTIGESRRTETPELIATNDEAGLRCTDRPVLIAGVASGGGLRRIDKAGANAKYAASGSKILIVFESEGNASEVPKALLATSTNLPTDPVLTVKVNVAEVPDGSRDTDPMLNAGGENTGANE